MPENFNGKNLKAGKYYVCRDGSITLLVASGQYLLSQEFEYLYDTRTEKGNLVFPSPVPEEHPKDIIGEAPTRQKRN